jgi:hypothetical protein
VLSKFFRFLQAVVSADKAPLVAATVAGLGLLAARFGFRLDASVTAYLGVILTGLAGAFTHVHFARKSVKRS